MAVTFSEVPADFGSVFEEQLYALAGLEEGQSRCVEVLTADAESPVGAKVVRGGDTVRINAAPSLRRCLAPAPLRMAQTGFGVDGGRCVTAVLRCDGRLSAVRIFTGAVRQLEPYEVLTVLPAERTIAWEERDEVSLCVPDCSMTYGWSIEGAAEHAFVSEEWVAQRGIVTLAVVMADLKRQLEQAGVAVGAVEAVVVTVAVAGEEVLRLRYRIVPRPAGSVRFCWFNTVGGCDCHTFGPTSGVRIAVGKADYVGSAGRDAMMTDWSRRETFTSGYLSQAWLQGVAELPAAPLVWRCEAEEDVPVVVEAAETVWRATEEPDAVTFVVQEKRQRVCQCF